MYTWIQELSNPETREHALIELSRKREVLPDLAPMLWHSFGTMAALLQEIVMIYPVINPPTLTVCYTGRGMGEERYLCAMYPLSQPFSISSFDHLVFYM